MNSQARTDDFSAANQLRDDAIDGVHGDIETNTGRCPGRAVYRRIDADQAPGAIEQWTSRVSRVDRGIGLDHALDWAAGDGFNFAVERRNDTGRQSLIQAERIADRIDALPDL